MPSYSLGELMSLATTDVGRRADIPISVASQRVNMAYFEVAGAVEHALLEQVAVSSTTSGENRIDLPTDYGEIVNLSLKWSTSTSSSAVSNTKTLRRMSASNADERGFLPVGEPQGYVMFNQWVEVWPSPDSAYSMQIRYRSMVTDMVQTSDVPSISTPFRHAIYIKTKELLHDYLGNYAASAAANRAYIDYMLRIKSDEARRQMGESRQGAHVIYDTPNRLRRDDSRYTWQ